MNSIKIEETTCEGLKRAFQITVPSEKVEERVTQLIAEKGKGYKEAGFRPGKVPALRLKALFEDDARRKAIPDLAEETATSLLKDRQFKPVGTPAYTIEKYTPEEGVVYSLSFELEPQVPEASTDGLKLRRAVVKVEETEIDELLKKWAEISPNEVPLKKPRAAREGDLVDVSIALAKPGKNAPAPHRTQILLNSQTADADALGALIGAKPGQVIEREVTLPLDLEDRKLAGKKMQATFELHTISEVKNFEVDDAFVAYMKYETMADFRAAAQKALAAERGNFCHLWIKRQVLDFFAQNYVFDVPTQLVENEYKNLWNQTYKELKIDPKAPEDAKAKKERAEFFKKEVGKKEEELGDFYKKAANRRVRLGFLLTAYGQKHGITVSNDELQGAFERELKQYPGQEKQIVDYYRQNPQAIKSLSAPIFEEKVIAQIAAAFPSEPEEMTLSVLEKMLENEGEI
jgi:trigger factor